MPTPKKGPRLGGSPSHQRLILSNLATQLFEHGRIGRVKRTEQRIVVAHTHAYGAESFVEAELSEVECF